MCDLDERDTSQRLCPVRCERIVNQRGYWAFDHGLPPSMSVAAPRRTTREPNPWQPVAKVPLHGVEDRLAGLGATRDFRRGLLAAGNRGFVKQTHFVERRCDRANVAEVPVMVKQGQVRLDRALRDQAVKARSNGDALTPQSKYRRAAASWPASGSSKSTNCCPLK